MPSKKRAQPPKRKADGSTEEGSGGKRAKDKTKEKQDVFTSSLESGQALTLGQGDVGQLGLGPDTLERKKPAVPIDLEGVPIVQVESGGMHTVALSKDGKVYTWGCNDDGALGRETTSEGEEEFQPGVVSMPDDVNIVMVSAGDSHTAALSDQGTVYAWGTYRDASGQIGLQPDGVKKKPAVILTSESDRIIKIASGNDHTAALTTSGNLFTLGCAEQGQLGRVKECFSARGGRRGLAYILEPALVRSKKGLKFKDVFCGSFATFVVAKTGSDVYAWGLNNYGQLGTGDVQTWHFPVKVKSLSQLNKSEKDKHITIANGQHHTIVCDPNGKVYALGRADYGRLGLGDGAKETALPAHITSLDNEVIEKVACGECVSFAVSDKGELYSWGMGSCLQLGNGNDEDDVTTPAKVQGKNLNSETHRVLGVSAGGQHTVILAAERT
ncbi:predicted protein [Nematostella vectensis]|uniref:RCC1-like domain-containing protein n=1 Tax=Nematostella vectensis TaxID=45351 RepID=A7SSP6_NEMVE|nr:regulator of chromosome condensation [Nematostella vectensis]EDO33245.1 predicted protein [Nematostella vectensis]|eukprot:XP_001625345.1 predicted protein [Nematostella vectensis]